MRIRGRLLGLIVLLIAAADSARANTGSPLWWTGGFHLLFGNFLIGLLEGGIIALRTRSPFGKPISGMIAANYLSMAAGWLILHFTFRAVELHSGIYFGRELVWGLTVGGWLLSVLIEWPFCHFVIPKARRSARASLRLCLLVQTISYVLIVPFYAGHSYMTLYRHVKPDRNLVAEQEPTATIFYLSPENGAVHAIELDGTNRRTIAVVDPGLEHDFRHLKISPSEDRTGHWDLELLPPAESDSPVVRNAAEGQAAEWEGNPPSFNPGLWGDAAYLPGASTVTDVSADYTPIGGLELTTGSGVRNLGFHTPFRFWYSSYPTVLPGDLVVFQLGDDIVLLDMATMRIGTLANGRSPVVVLKGGERKENPPPGGNAPEADGVGEKDAAGGVTSSSPTPPSSRP